MKKFAILSVLAFLLSASAVRADVTGNWLGKLQYTASDGSDESWDCEFGIATTDKYLYVDDSSGCLYTPDYITRFELRDDEVYYGNQLFGHITDDQLVLSKTTSNEAWNLTTTLQSDGSMEVSETYVRGTFNDKTYGILGEDTPAKRATMKPHRLFKKNHR